MSRWSRLKQFLNQYFPRKVIEVGRVEVRILDLHNKRIVPEKEMRKLSLDTVILENEERLVGEKGNSLAVTHPKHWLDCVSNNGSVETSLLKREGKDEFHILISKPEAKA